MQVLVTGGCGYKGSVLVPKLLAGGHKVWVLDIMWFGNNFEEFISLLEKKGIISSYIIYARGSKKLNMIVYLTDYRIKVKMDVYKVSKADKAPFLLYLTGDGTFNIYMRRVAEEKGYLLNQHGLYKVKRTNGKVSKIEKKIRIKSEKDIFSKLGITCFG